MAYDRLGSVRMVTDQNGNAATIFSPLAKKPPANTAGRGPQFGSMTDMEQKFTSQIRDNETGMDYQCQM